MVSINKKFIRYSQGGHLTIDLNPSCVVLKFGSWKENIPVSRWVDGEFEEVVLDDIEIPLFQNIEDLKEDDPLLLYQKSFPFPDIFTSLSAVKTHQLTVLRLSLNPAGRDLLFSNLNLLWLVAHRMAEENISLDAGIAIIEQKRHDILRWASYKSIVSKSDLKLVAKLKIDFVEDDFDLIMGLFCEQILTTPLRYVDFPIPVKETIDLLDYKELIGAKSLWSAYREYKGNIPRGHLNLLSDAWVDTERLGQALKIRDRQIVVNQAPNAVRLKIIHDRWTIKLNEIEDENLLKSYIDEYGDDQMPPPPFPGDGSKIQPISKISDLMSEGHFMQHCVGGYVYAIFTKRSYIYKVLEPERATLEIDLSEAVPRIKQLRLAKNADPHMNTKKFVEKFVKIQVESNKSNLKKARYCKKREFIQSP